MRRDAVRKALFVSVFIVSASPAFAAPTRLFLQEEGRLAPARAIFVDVMNSTGMWVPKAESELRVGLPFAEGILKADGLGAKVALPNGWFPYFVANVGTGPASFDFRLGAAYLWRLPGLNINFDPEVLRVARETVFNFNGAAFAPLESVSWLGGVQVGFEFMLTSAAGADAGLAAGLRWAPRDWLVADLMLGGAGGAAGYAALHTPAALRVNIQF